MKLNTSYIIAGSLVLFGGIWFAVNNSGEEEPLPVATPATAKENARRAMPTVQVRRVTAQEHPNVLELYGQTRANREVAIETDLNAARVLAEKGFQSSTRVTAFEAQLDGAKAALKQAEIEADNINIRAPFSGIWERQDAQIGDYLSPGMSCGLLVDLSPLKVDAQLTEAQLGKVARGDTATIQLATGENITGKIAFIEAKADPSTRTFRAEIHVPNDDLALKAGVTGTVRIKSGLTLAHQIPGNILAIADNGDVGIRYIDGSNIVRFASVDTIDEDANGLWVTGLPESVRIITQGQDFVSVDMEVKPEENYSAPSASQGQQVSGTSSGLE